MALCASEWESLLDLQSRVILHSHEPLFDTPTMVRAMAMVLLNLNPVVIQVWRPMVNTTDQYTLVWQKQVHVQGYLGYYVVSIQGKGCLLLQTTSL